MRLGINQQDSNIIPEQIDDNKQLVSSISGLSQSVSDKVSVLSDKLLNLKLSKEAFNKTLLVILGSAIFAQPVETNANGFSWKVVGDVSSLDSFEICSSDNPDKNNTSNWGDCKSIPPVTIPPYCVEDPDDNATYYEGGYDLNMLRPYISIRIKDTLGNISGFSEIIDISSLNNNIYSKVNLDYDKDGEKDVVEYKNKKLYIKYAKNGLFCISKGEGGWDKIIENYGRTGNEKLRIINYNDDNTPDIALCDIENKICDIDLSNNGYGSSLDLTDQPYSLFNTDMLLYKYLTGETYLTTTNSDGTSLSGVYKQQVNWNSGQEVIALKFLDNVNKTFSYNKATGQYFIGTLNASTHQFETISGYLIPGLNIIDLGDFFGDGKGAFLGKNTIGGNSYVYRLNDNGNGFDYININMEDGDEILAGNFTKDNNKDIIRCNKNTGVLKRMVFNSSNNTFTEETLNTTIEPGQDVVVANLRGVGLDDIVSLNKTTGMGSINRFKLDEKSLFKIPFGPLPVGLDMYSGDFDGDGVSNIFLYNKTEKTAGSGKSSTYMLTPDKDGMGFDGLNTDLNWNSGLDIKIRDINGDSLDGIIAYNPETAQTYFFNTKKVNGDWDFSNYSQFYLQQGFTIIPGNFDNQ